VVKKLLIIVIGVAQKALRLWCGGPLSQTGEEKTKAVFSLHRKQQKSKKIKKIWQSENKTQ
jgi:hypothetical protein